MTMSGPFVSGSASSTGEFPDLAGGGPSERVAANGRPRHPNAAAALGAPPLGRGGVSRDERFSPSTPGSRPRVFQRGGVARAGCWRTGPARGTATPVRSGRTDVRVDAASPVLSILLPVRNEGLNLTIMLKILKAVVDVPHEVLVVFDDERDASRLVVDRMAPEDSTIRAVHNQIGPGIPNALRAGVERARGKY